MAELDPSTLRWASQRLKRKANLLRKVKFNSPYASGYWYAGETLLTDARALESKPRPKNPKPKGKHGGKADG